MQPGFRSIKPSETRIPGFVFNDYAVGVLAADAFKHVLFETCPHPLDVDQRHETLAPWAGVSVNRYSS
jgi:hypothetical protein